MSTFKLQNRIEDTGRVITGMVVTDDDHLLLCDHFNIYSKLVAVYYPSGKYMKTIDVSYPPWDIAIIPRTHRAMNPPYVTNNDVVTGSCYTKNCSRIWYG
jgi:hypothetical protein